MNDYALNLTGGRMKKISELPPKIGLVLSYVICVNMCAFTRNMFKIIMWYVFKNSYHSVWLVNFSNLIAYSIMFWCGCLMGYLIQEKSIFHASLSVAIGVLFTYLLSGIIPNDFVMVFEGILTGAVLGGIGGGSTQIVRKILTSRSHN